jgi:mannose-1-phosphate guanylyltransferase/mannose-6-phosphate isomerase
MIANPSIRPVILCGGSGTRLWPISREALPKQFVPLIEGQSLLELTMARVAPLGAICCIANEEHRFLVKDALEKTATTGQLLLEPEGRNTAAAMACMAAWAQDEELLLFLPADHFIPDSTAFQTMVMQGVPAALAGRLVTFGVFPHFPSAAYGYIEQGPVLEEQKPARQVARFVEKPPVAQAQEMILTGNYWWNAGIFLVQAKVLRQALEQYAPDIAEGATRAMSLAHEDGLFTRPNKEAFLALRSESIDYAVMEKSNQVAVVPFHGAWSDVGSWNAIAQLFEPNEEGNRIVGDGWAWRSGNTFIHAPHRTAVALGVNDLVIVDTPDALLVAHINEAEHVKDVVKHLKKEEKSVATHHYRVQRPWGWYESLESGPAYQVKRINVKSGAALSLQLHHQRAEHWIVVHGLARVTCDESVFDLQANQSTYIPKESKHRLENIGPTDLELIEVQTGEYLGEDDIVRFMDVYGRN